MLLRSYAQGSFGAMAEKGTNLNRKRLSSLHWVVHNPHWVVHKSIVNMKGMNVNLHMIRPVPINR
jgi:aspartate/tyrosine/aromatic aminotransferase